MKKRKIFYTKWLLGLLTSIVLFSIINYQIIKRSARDAIYCISNESPVVEFGMILGTPKYLPNGRVNNYYKSRISSVFYLYQKSKINKIIISADTLNKYQENEIELIKNDLLSKGVKNIDLICDVNGSRTWNSILEAKKWVNKDKVIIISQNFHLERALYIAKKKNLQAIGYKAKGSISNKLWIREILARVKMRIDLLIN